MALPADLGLGIEGILLMEFAGNTVYQLILFFLTIVFSIVVAKLAYIVIRAVGKKVTAKTKFEFDERLLEALNKPIAFFILVIGIKYAFEFIYIPAGMLTLVTNVLWLLVVAGVAWVAMRIANMLIRFYVLPVTTKMESKFYGDFIPIVNKVVNAVIAFVVLLAILENFGINIATLIASFGILGMAVAFAARDMIANAFGGFSIFASKPFFIGDYIKVSGVEGTVKEVSIRSTKLETKAGELIMIPNNKIATGVITNMTRRKEEVPKAKEAPAPIVVKMELGLRHDTSTSKMNKIMSSIRGIIKKTKGCSDPEVAFTEFKESALNITISYNIAPKYAKKELKVREDVNMKIKRALDKEKIELAFPTRTVYLERGSTFA